MFKIPLAERREQLRAEGAVRIARGLRRQKIGGIARGKVGRRLGEGEPDRLVTARKAVLDAGAQPAHIIAVTVGELRIPHRDGRRLFIAQGAQIGKPFRGIQHIEALVRLFVAAEAGGKLKGAGEICQIARAFIFLIGIIGADGTHSEGERKIGHRRGYAQRGNAERGDRKNDDDPQRDERRFENKFLHKVKRRAKPLPFAIGHFIDSRNRYEQFYSFYHTRRENATEYAKKVRKDILYARRAYGYGMKKRLLCTFALAALLPLLAACAPYDYSDRVSEIRSDLFLAETQDFSLTLSCVSREYPYADDGIPCPMSDMVEICIVPARETGTVEVYCDDGWGGEASFSAVFGDYRFSQGVDAFPQSSVSLRVVLDGESTEIAATSVKNEATLTPQDALDRLVKAEKETLGRMEQDGVLCAEFCIRLLRRDKNYYYAAVTDGKERTALLLDAETGEILARRTDTL